MARFYVSWITDCAYAAMHVHSVFEAPSLKVARAEWASRVYEQNRVAIAPAYGPHYEELWELPAFLAAATKEEVQDFYGPPEPCSFKQGNRCTATTSDRPEGCGMAAFPYGCYQKMHEEWMAKWGKWRGEVDGPAFARNKMVPLFRWWRALQEMLK